MSWYNVFYWVTIADGVKKFFHIFSNIFTTFSVISLIIYIIFMGFRAQTDNSEADNEEIGFWVKRFGRFFWISLMLCLFTWVGYVFTPSKKDALVIIAGGAVGNFISSDSSAKQIPAEMTLLLREKLKSEISELKNPLSVDTLAEKSKEELIELLKNK